MDSVHNFSDELALVCLSLAFILPAAMSRNLQRSANLFNSLGLVAVCGVVVWQAFERLLNPTPVFGVVPIAVGFVAAAGNWGVARLLREPSKHNSAVRLAYLHNLGDVLVSLAPMLAGLLITLTGRVLFDPLIALLIALWIIGSTLAEVLSSHEQLLWPDQLVCGHESEEAITLR
jgi:cobalt-zinc-cadmium efflux system protein